MARKLLAMLICACVLTGAASCSKQDGIVVPSPDVTVEEGNSNDVAMQTPPTPTHPAAPEENHPTTEVTELHIANLYKLCKVWGFVKYTHLAFLSGEKDWDEELLGLIPFVQFAAEDEVNDILYDWFESLGDDGYDGNSSSYYLIQTKEYFDMSDRDRARWDNFIDRIEEIDWLCHTDTINSYTTSYTYIFRIADDHLQDFQSLTSRQGWISSTAPLLFDDYDANAMSDLKWIADESYLGAPLSSALSRFREIPFSCTSETPLHYSDEGLGVFRNESKYQHKYRLYAGTVEIGYRLLGLFRLWNAIEYYFPYKDIMDESWNELLLEFIPKMMEGTDYQSYCLTLFALGAKTQDAHVMFSSQIQIMNSRYGFYAIPTLLDFCEGQIVVRNIVRGVNQNMCPLRPGDVVVKIDGVDIFDIIAERVQYIAVPNEEKIRDVLRYLPLCTNGSPTVTVLREGVMVSNVVSTVFWQYSDFSYTYADTQNARKNVLLAGNIGLINPSQFDVYSIHAVMSEFSNTNGLIIDLRQYPGSMFYLMAEYLLDEPKPFALMSRPFLTVPGLYFDCALPYAGPGLLPMEATGRYFYDKPVVILMNQYSQSRCETTIMALRLGPNVTVIGSNSIGADGNVASLLLPCGNTVTFTSMGVYTPEGGQIQRIGLSPDIYMEPTIEGIRDGRDELMEAAVAFLLGQ